MQAETLPTKYGMLPDSCIMNIEKADLSNVSLDDLTPADKWILSKANSLVKEVTDNMENYDFGVAVSKLNDFIWEEFCDWYIEMVKPRLYNEEDTTKAAALCTLKKVLINVLKVITPIYAIYHRRNLLQLTG